MATKCEVFGWLLVDDAARVLVREESGHISLQSAKPEERARSLGDPDGLVPPRQADRRSGDRPESRLRDGVGCDPARRSLSRRAEARPTAAL